MTQKELMNEELMAYLWFFRYCGTHHTSTDGQEVRIVNYGLPNHNAGPDVFNAKAYIGTTLWAGNIEFHVKASDWFLHHHQNDPLYDSVILHVVAENNATIKRTNGTIIPQIVLQCPPQVADLYAQISSHIIPIGCAPHFHKLETERLLLFMDRLLIERLEQRAAVIQNKLQQHLQSWEEVFYIQLARQFGCSINADAFEQLAQSLPNKLLARHRDHPTQIDALIFGQAGLLASPVDNYARTLQQQYHMLQHKYRLTPMEASRWRWLRMRPGNFPTIRMAELSTLIQHSHNLFSQMLEADSIRACHRLFQYPLTDYWQKNYNFGKPSKHLNQGISRETLNLIIINVVAPFLFTYGLLRQQEPLQNRALQLLSTIKAEHNSLIAPFLKLGVPCHSAADSQALLQLRCHYCDENRCLQCPIGHRILATSVKI